VEVLKAELERLQALLLDHPEEAQQQDVRRQIKQTKRALNAEFASQGLAQMEDNISMDSQMSQEMQIEGIKEELERMQASLMDADEGQKKGIKKQVTELKRALRRANSSLRNSKDETGSVGSRGSMGSLMSLGEFDIEKMKADLEQLQETLLDAPESERKAAKQKIRDVKKNLKLAMTSYKRMMNDETSSVNSFTSDRSLEEMDIERMKSQLAQLQEFLMDAPDNDKKIIKMQVKELKKALKAAVSSYKSMDDQSSVHSEAVPQSP